MQKPATHFYMECSSPSVAAGILSIRLEVLPVPIPITTDLGAY
jgi:hypothetical protein